MRTLRFAAPALGLVTLFTAALSRAETFSFTSSGEGYYFSANGTLTGTADPTVAGAYDITSVDGNVNGVPLAIYSPGTATASSPQNVTLGNSPYTFDNVIYTTGDALDLYGLLFSDGGDHTNFYFQDGSYFFTNDENVNGTAVTSFPITFSVTDITTSTAVTPEPSSIALLGTGLLGLGGIVRRRLTR